MGKRHEHTLCWDCSHATDNKCPWATSERPVPGWRARPTTIRFASEKTDSFHVYYCPLFDRDAERGGLKKVALGGETDERSNCNNSGLTATVYRMANVSHSGNLGSGDSPVADRRDRQARGLKADREILDLAFGIIEKAVQDWKVLEYGRKESAMVEKVDWVHREDLLEFFFSKWFARLCEPLAYTPEEIRAALNIPEELRWTMN